MTEYGALPLGTPIGMDYADGMIGIDPHLFLCNLGCSFTASTNLGEQVAVNMRHDGPPV